jgi:hypothetical protein
MWFSITPSPCVSFFIWITQRDKKWFNFKIPFWSVHTIIPFPTCSPTRYLRPIVPKFYHVLAQGWGVWFTTRSIFPAFPLFSTVFFTSLYTWLGLPHPSIVGILRCVCTHPIDPMGIHFLFCAHGIECNLRHLCHHYLRCRLPHGMKTVTCTSFN